jgi:uracil phosphoribosyltransferase
MTFVEGMLDLVPTARVAHIGLSGNLLGVFRDRIETVEAVVQDAALCRAAT